MDNKQVNNQLQDRLRLESEMTRKVNSDMKGTINLNEAVNKQLTETYYTLAYIINDMGLIAKETSNVDTVDELFEMMLTPLGVMYEKVDISHGKWKNFDEIALAFTEDNRPVIIRNGFLGKQCYRVENEYWRKMSDRINLQATAYKIYRPILTEKFTLAAILDYFIHTIPFKSIAKIIIISFILTALGTVIPKINSVVLGDYINRTSGAGKALIGAATVFAVTGIMTALLTGINSLLNSNLKQRAGRTMETAIMAKVLGMPLPFFREESSGKISTFISNARKLGEMAIDILMGSSVTALFSLIYIPQMMSFAPALVMPAIIILLVQLAVGILSSLFYADNQRTSMALDVDMKDMTYTTLKGIQKIKEAGAQQRAYIKWGALYAKKLECNHNPPLIVKIQSVLASTISASATIIFLAMTGMLDISGSEYIAFTSSYALVASAFTALSSLFTSIVSLQPSIEQISPLFSYKDSDNDGMIKYVKEIEGNIAFDSVSFAYAPNSGFEFNNFSYVINAGERIGIAGPSGCGKSTLINMLMGINPPSSGTIYLDGNNMKSLDSSVINRRIGFVAQYSKLLPGTIRYNISLGLDDVSDEDIWQALDMAGIGDYIRSLDTALDTQISETNSGGFSGGQKQSLMLARAFVKKPKLLILDEATSALDERTQAHVLSSIYGMECTLLMVAHRLSTIKDCDRILMFDCGHVVEEGTYDELIAAGGKFAEFARLSEGR